MAKAKQPFCIHCNRHVGYRVETRPMSVNVRGTDVPYRELFATCAKCSKEIYVDLINDLNCDSRNRAYEEQISV